MSDKPVILLDNGHGDNTPGKRSPIWSDGRQLFEYSFNRDIVSRIAKGLSIRGIAYFVLVPEIFDVSLPERVRRANEHSNAVFISVHANAGGGSGFEVYTSRGQTKSDAIATIFCAQAVKDFPEFKVRPDYTDKDPDKEAGFYVLKYTNCPAILTENLFMDNQNDCNFLLSEQGRERIANYHINAIEKVIQLWPSIH